MANDIAGLVARFLDTAPDAMLLVAPSGEIVLANERADAMFRAADSGLRGRSVDQLVPAASAAAHAEHRARFRSDPTPRVMGSGLALVARRVDGSEFPVDVSLGTLEGEGEPLVVAAVRDTTEQVEAQRALAASAFIVASSDDAIFVLDPDGVVTGWNRGAERLTGRPADEVMGTVTPHPLGLVDPELEVELIERARLGEHLDHYRSEIVRTDGSRVPISLALAAVRDERGHLVGTSGIAHDITEEMTAQDTLKEVQDRLAETQRLADIGLWAYDLESGEVQWSIGMHHIAGVSPARFGGDIAGVFALIPDPDRERVERELSGAIDRRETFHVEHCLARPDGDLRWLSTHGTVRTLPSGAVTVHGVSQDLTERQRLVEALQTTDRLKDRFLGVVSHELRTPLTSIVGFSQMLLDNADPETRPWIEILARNAEEMHGMVERILDYSRLHAGAMELHFETIPVGALIDELRSLVAVPLMDHDLAIDLEPGLAVLADRNAMFGILVNLLTNSAKFSPSGSLIRIEGRSVPDRDEIRLRVVDEGHGIPVDQRESVFERFHQVESGDIGTRHGVGVGLTIVKEYVEAMSGSVWVEPAGPAGGTAITVQLQKPSSSR